MTNLQISKYSPKENKNYSLQKNAEEENKNMLGYALHTVF